MRARMRFRTFVLLTLVAGMLIPGTGKAITDEALFRNFRFNFVNPGGRTLGLAGAFIAAADDATAAQANPAALHYISGSEFFIEFRSLQTDTQISSSSAGSLVHPNQPGDLPFLSLTEVVNPDDISNVSFLSYAQPFKLGAKQRRLTLAFSRQILLQQKLSLTENDAATEARIASDVFPVIPNEDNTGLVRYSIPLAVNGDSDTEIVYWNAGASLQVHRDFSVGLTLSLATLDIQADSLGAFTDPQFQILDPTNPRLPGSEDTDFFRSVINDTDSDLVYTIGLHWHPDSVFATGISPWQFGAVMRKGAEFSFAQERFKNGVLNATAPVSLNVPDRYGVGASYKPGDNWVFTMDYERIEYSDLLEGFEVGVNPLTDEDVTDVILGSTFARDPQYDVEDADVFRIGAERIFGLRNGVFTVRAGYFRAPDNKIAMTSFSEDPTENSVYLDAFSGGEDENHFTGGATYGFGHHTIDIGADFFSGGKQLVVSYIFRRF